MRVVVAPDSWTGTLSAVEAARAIAAGWHRSAPSDQVVQVPVSDGGPGFVDVLASVLGGEVVTVEVTGPLSQPVPASWLRVGSTAYVESAQACGLHLVLPGRRGPAAAGAATSRGVGELVVSALDAGVERVVVGLGGTGSTDGGAGTLAALGVGAVDADGTRLDPGGAALGRLAGLQGAADPRLAKIELTVATDVDNPLLGLSGAAAGYGPQKGAGPDMVQRLDHGLGVWSRLLTEHLGLDPALVTAPGAGAAGGLGFGLMAVGGRRVPGIHTAINLLGLPEQVDSADLVVTGEGSFDWQSLRGKAAAGVAALAAERGLVCLVLAGQVSVGRQEAAAAGIEASYSLAEHLGSTQAALDDTAAGLSSLAARIAGQWSR